MSYLREIRYEIVLEDSFWVFRNCPKCGRKTHFINTKKFRVNANGNKLDVWLIYQCRECRHTLNLAIYERRKVSAIPREEYQRFLDNEEELAEMYGKNMELFRKNRADIDLEKINYNFVRQRESGAAASEDVPFSMEKGGPEEQIPVIIHNPYGLNIRPEKQIAAVLELSRSQVKSMLEKGKIEIRIVGGDVYVYQSGQNDHT